MDRIPDVVVTLQRRLDDQREMVCIEGQGGAYAGLRLAVVARRIVLKDRRPKRRGQAGARAAIRTRAK